MKYYYDVMLSFAGEDRKDVEEYAGIYSNKTKYENSFVPQHYVKKDGPNMNFLFINVRIFKK